MNNITNDNITNNNSKKQTIKLKSKFLMNIQLLSLMFLLLTIIFQLEIAFFLLLKYFTNTKIISIIIIILFHLITINYLAEDFVYLLQFPIIGKSAYRDSGTCQASDLIIALSSFIDGCEIIIDNEQNINPKIYNNIIEMNDGIDIWIRLYNDMKKKFGLSNYQKILYNNLKIWSKHFKDFKIIENLREMLKNKNNYINQDFYKNLVYIILDSNFIIKIAEDYICDNRNFLSFKQLYNYCYNDTFSSVNQYKVLFQRSFKERSKTFITSDNKKIDYCLITAKIILDDIKKKSINKKPKKIQKQYTSSFSEFSSTNDLEIPNTPINDEPNLIFYCNANSMIFEFFTIEKFLFYIQKNCDILLWNYRGYGLSSAYSSFIKNKKDILELFDEITKLGRWKKYGVHGYSVGGVTATYLAKNRYLDVLISDRNFSSIDKIVENYSGIGGFLSFLCKFVIFGDKNLDNYLNTLNERCCKIIMCDPEDCVIPNGGSIKSCVSEYAVKNFLSNNKKNKKYILDLIFLPDEKNDFINSLIFLNQYIINMNINETNNKKFENFSKEAVYDDINNFFDCFNTSTQDLFKFSAYKNKKDIVKYIDVFFNNMFIWGTSIRHKKFDTRNNEYYFNKAIGILELLEDELKEMELSEILKNIKNIKEFVIKIKYKFGEIFVEKPLEKGYLIRLSCGHNSSISEFEERLIIQKLNEANFFE